MYHCTLPTEPRQIERVLLVRPSALGDVCRTVPLIASLRAAHPHARIDWLVQRGFEAAVQHHPALACGQVIPFDRKRLGQWWNPSAMADLAALARRLRAANYDTVIDAQGLLRSGLFARLTGAAVRIGPADAREGAARFYTHPVNVPPGTHTVDAMLALLAPLSVAPRQDLRLYPGPAEARVAADDPRLSCRFVVLAPTSRWPAKQWPADRFASVAAHLLANGFERAVIVGASGERSQCRPLLELAAHDPRLIDLVGATSVSQLMAVISRAALLIGSDSAAVHMAVGLGVPCVALYGPTSLSTVGPVQWRDRGGAPVVALQRLSPGERIEPGMHKRPEPGQTMMSRITTGDVIDAACCATR